MGNIKKIKAIMWLFLSATLLFSGCGGGGGGKTPGTEPQLPLADDVQIIFLHHSTGGCIWDGGVVDWFINYNTTNSKSYQIIERGYPKSDPYGWRNYPYDYWNIWVNHAGETKYEEEDTLELLSQTYKVVIWKHCFPVSDIESDTGSPDINSEIKTIENYQLQYNALKDKMLQFSGVRFIVWTGAALKQSTTTPEKAQRSQQFFYWVKNTWDETGDNIYIWDFYQRLYFRPCKWQ